MLKLFHILLLFAALNLNLVICFEREMTVSIDAGKRECFYESVKMDQIIDIEYQVIDGGHGDLDINFELSEASGRIIYADFKKSDNIHRLTSKRDADYKFCFDNTISTFNRKTVFFELIIETEGEESAHLEDAFEGLTQEEFYDMKVQDILDSIGRVRMHITKARQLQDFIKSYESKDRNVAEKNFHLVNFWSIFQIISMICLGSLQVFMLKSLFDTNSKGHLFWQKISKKF